MASQAATPEVLAALEQQLADEDKDVRYYVAYVLGTLGAKAATPKVIAVLTQMLDDETTYSRDRNAAARVLKLMIEEEVRVFQSGSVFSSLLCEELAAGVRVSS